MTVGLDTSVVVRLLVGVPEEQADAARLAMEEHAGSIVISDIVVGESWFALVHHYSVPPSRANSALSSLLDDPRVRSDGIAPRVLAQLRGKSSGASVMDRLIHGGYEAEGASLLTFDRVAARLPGARLLG